MVKPTWAIEMDCLNNDCSNLRAGATIAGSYSFFTVCDLLSDVLNGGHCITRYMVSRLPKTVVFVGNPMPPIEFTAVFEEIKKTGRKVIPYVAFEGDLYATYFLEFIVPSQWLADLARKRDLKVIDVIPHGIELLPIPHKPFEESRDFLYIAGTDVAYRKWPGYLKPFYQQFGKWIDVVTDDKNKYRDYFHVIGKAYSMPRTELYKLYSRYRFYLNLSDAEGFGLTPLEAASVGTVPILGRFPPFTEIYSDDCAVWIDWRGDVAEQDCCGFEVIHRHVLNVKDVIDAFNRARLMTKDEWLDKSEKCRELARKYDYKKVYSRFLNYV